MKKVMVLIVSMLFMLPFDLLSDSMDKSLSLNKEELMVCKEFRSKAGEDRTNEANLIKNALSKHNLNIEQIIYLLGKPSSQDKKSLTYSLGGSQYTKSTALFKFDKNVLVNIQILTRTEAEVLPSND